MGEHADGSAQEDAAIHRSYTVADRSEGCDEGGRAGAASHLVAALAWIKARSARDLSFDADLFSDPAWDMLLDLYVSHCQGRRVSVTDLCIVASVPTTTALRWIALLEARGLIAREADKADRRRWNVSLTRHGLGKLELTLERAAEASRQLGFGLGGPVE